MPDDNRVLLGSWPVPVNALVEHFGLTAYSWNRAVSEVVSHKGMATKLMKAIDAFGYHDERITRWIMKHCNGIECAICGKRAYKASHTKYCPAHYNYFRHVVSSTHERIER